MPLPDRQQQVDFVINFGGGLHTIASPKRIGASEAAAGKNFNLDLDNGRFRRRDAYDLAGTATNAQAIRGFGQLIKADNTVSTIVQAGTTVYEWDGSSSFTSIGTVSANMRLHAPRQHNWPLDGKLIITDLALQQPVMEWDGTTFQTLPHDLGGDFYARNCLVENERAYYANTISGGTATKHLIAVSERGNHDGLSTANRPSSSLAASDPFFLLAPDFGYINAILSAFGRVIFSTRAGRIYQFTGTDSTNFAITDLYADSGAIGDEPMTFIGNDVAWGRAGKIESLYATSNYGDVSSDDLSRPISDLVKDINHWDLYYNSRVSRVYAMAPDQGTVYVLNKAILDAQRTRTLIDIAGGSTASSKVSPWSAWTTDHSLGFNPTAMAVLRNPGTGLETTYMGGSDGKIYRLEGDGGQDAGTTDIEAERLSAVFSVDGKGDVFDVTGYVSYRKIASQTLTLTFEYQGEEIFDRAITVSLDAPTAVNYWNGSAYWGGSYYWGVQFETRLHRKRIAPAGFSGEFQVRANVSGSSTFDIEEIGLKFTAANKGTT